ncbi:MAG: outer membrane beta-barrel protein [Syntrophothermus sp.]
MKLSNKLLSILLISTLFVSSAQSQVVNETTKKRIGFGIGLFNDFWVNTPNNVDIRPINQGFQVFAMYNTPFGKSDFGFSIGLGLTTHNMYGNFVVNRKADSTFLMPIPDSVSWKKSKITLTYLELPIEFNFKSKTKVSVGIGFKLGMLAGSNSKYKGEGHITTNQYTINTDETVRFRTWGIKGLEQFVYGPTLRVGYKWFNVNAYYMLSSVFKKAQGPDMYPVSVGFVIMPF